LAAALGFVVPFVPAYIWAIDSPHTAYHLVDGAVLASLVAVWGGIIALIPWRIAYRRVEIPASPKPYTAKNSV
jgi:hypothetical protein